MDNWMQKYRHCSRRKKSHFLIYKLKAKSLDILDLQAWLVDCFGFNSPLRQYFSLYRAVSQREGERGEKR